MQPCDEDYVAITNKSYADYCSNHRIDSHQTEYAWSVSADEVNYNPIELNTIFTSHKGKVLKPLYLEKGIYVNCSVRAVANSGTPGNVRYSESALLSEPLSSEGRCNSTFSYFHLHKYNHFSGDPEVKSVFVSFLCAKCHNMDLFFSRSC